jgi:hypothetical protein
VHLSTVVLTNADGTLTAETVSPEAVELNIALAHVGVGNKEPGTEDSLGKDIEDSVGNDLSINASLAGTVGNTPDNGVGSPEDGSVGSDGDEESAELVTLGAGVGATVKAKVPEDEDEGNAGNCVPAPLLGSVLSAESSKQTSKNHDQVGNDHHDHVSSRHASKETEIEEQERGGDAPVDVSRPEDLAAHLVVRVGDVLVMVAHRRAVVGAGLARRHSEVGDSSREGDHGGDDVVETLGHGDIPGQEGEESRGEDHDDEDDPEGSEAIVASTLVVGRGGNDGRNRLHAMTSVDNGRCEILKHLDVLFR